MKPSSIKGKSQVFVGAYFFFFLQQRYRRMKKRSDVLESGKICGKESGISSGRDAETHKLIFCLVLPAHSLSVWRRFSVSVSRGECIENVFPFFTFSLRSPWQIIALPSTVNVLKPLGKLFREILCLFWERISCPRSYFHIPSILFCWFFSSSSSFCSLVFLIWATDSISWPGWWLSRQLMAPAKVKSQETFESLTFSVLRSLSMFERQVSTGQHTTAVKWKCCVSIVGLSCVGCLVCRCSLLPWKWINVTIVL